MSDCNFIGPCVLRTESATCRNIGMCQHQHDVNQKYQKLMCENAVFIRNLSHALENVPHRKTIGPQRAAENRPRNRMRRPK